VYLNFYGLKEAPFNTTPDPKFLFLTGGHREALAQLLYGVNAQKGFLTVTGEVGTGKTTLLRTLLQRLDGTVAVAFVTHTTLPFDGLLEYILEDLGIAKGQQTQAQRLVALQNFLIERRRAGQNTVIVFDEAQNLAVETLEQIRLLSNFETATDKLLQILLSGQPELTEKLQRPELRQLRQRIALRCRVFQLDAEETRHYIRTRLRIAGGRDLGIFEDRAMARIAAYSGGIPRQINILCDHCLVIGYADRRRRIDVDTVDEGIRYMADGAAPRRRSRPVARASSGWPRWTWLTAGIAGGVLGLMGVMTWSSDPVGWLVGRLGNAGGELWQAIWRVLGG
jgi:general secretion pathway protein A